MFIALGFSFHMLFFLPKLFLVFRGGRGQGKRKRENKRLSLQGAEDGETSAGQGVCLSLLACPSMQCCSSYPNCFLFFGGGRGLKKRKRENKRLSLQGVEDGETSAGQDALFIALSFPSMEMLFFQPKLFPFFGRGGEGVLRARDLNRGSIPVQEYMKFIKRTHLFLNPFSRSRKVLVYCKNQWIPTFYS